MTGFSSTRILSILFISCLLSACPPHSYTERSCPSFDLSLIAGWTPYKVGSRIILSDASGSQQAYRVDKIEDGHESTQLVIDDGSPQCQLISTHLYISDDNSHAIRLEFLYLENNPEEFLQVEIHPQEPVGEERRGYSYTVYLRSSEDMAKANNREYDTALITYSASMQVGSSTYTDVVSYSKLPGKNQPPYNLPPDKKFRIKRVVFARHAGLVGMEYEDGRFFTLVQ